MARRARGGSVPYVVISDSADLFDGIPDPWRVDPAEDQDLETLHRRLVGESRDGHGSAREALELLEHHRTDPRGMLTTALLVCTHRRWKRCSRTLVRELAASGLLDADALDELAGWLLRHERVVFAVPAAWLGVTLDLPPGSRLRTAGVALGGGTGDREAAGQRLPQHRHVPAAARRWAACHLLERGLVALEEVLGHARQVDDSAGGAIVCGALDAWGALRSDALEQALTVALGWPRGSVRRRALDVLAATGRVERAEARAAADTDALVRRWQPPAPDPDDPQPSLFTD